jgi:hypothetical protein
MRKLLVLATALSLPILTAQTWAQSPQPTTEPGKSGMHDQRQMPMMQGMDGKMMNCPMMQQTASLQERVRALEEKAGISTPKPKSQ